MELKCLFGDGKTAVVELDLNKLNFLLNLAEMKVKDIEAGDQTKWPASNAYYMQAAHDLIEEVTAFICCDWADEQYRQNPPPESNVGTETDYGSWASCG